ncbi:ribose-phosphate pyrophosphokinase [Sulfuriferula multivorans]|uniref:ribose-phosphate diphosphokinase n=1 Tax=Sulfuriferula multivorans TaxID=1559896 RepID=A0A401JCW9_9PROT|nr:ribose-phosphate pyrophosphokinase [Sulfuriferula multivorans]GBL45400.1 ribose-phosphate pyrophosphokinase [Sulfuriferula multivorans]
MTLDDLCLFALDTSRPYGERVAKDLGVALCAHEEREFEDGEHKARPLENVRGKDVYVIQSLYGEPGMSVNDKLVRLLFFIGAVKDASAARVTAVCPYLAYARKDRRSKSRDPVSSRYVAQLFETLGTDRVLTLDVHNPAAYQNAFRIPAEHLEASGLFVAWFAARLQDEAVVVVSPDVGGVKRAEAFRQALARALGRPVASTFMEKSRSEGVVSGAAVVGEVGGRTAIIIDDLISTGTTLARAAAACKALGAKRVYAAVSHGVFVGAAGQVLADPALDKVLVTDAIPPFRLPPALLGSRVEVLASAPLFAEAIRRLHSGGSLVELLAGA